MDGEGTLMRYQMTELLLRVQRELSRSPSDSQRTFDPEQYSGPLNTLTHNNNNSTDHYTT
eukprot:12275708-Heterocapsa_arctica.AAC.1